MNSSKMSQINSVIEVIGAVSALSGFVGATSGLVVDFYRRRIRSKAAEYAAQGDFSRLGNAVQLLQTTIDKHIITSASQHSEVCQRVARLEGRQNG